MPAAIAPHQSAVELERRDRPPSVCGGVGEARSPPTMYQGDWLRHRHIKCYPTY
ncbi:MAG: hypothetical protein F6K30_06845 [Cyanothece sp. SIO2G6]|nr:hypothetical protein [Cyanothece sp. SIO2G6]